MGKSIAFWVLMLLWLVLGAYVGWTSGVLIVGTHLVPWLAVAVLGWGTIGAPIQ